MIYIKCLKIGAFIFTMLAMVLFPVELIHALIWIFKHIYLLTQFLISSIVINLFETSRRTTDYMIAYTLILFGFIFWVKLFLFVKSRLQRIHDNWSAFVEKQTIKLKNSMKNMPAMKRLKWLFLSMNIVLVATNF